MFKKSIGLLVALCMLLSSGAAMAEMEMTPVAETKDAATEKQLVVSDVELTVNDETYVLDPALKLKGYADGERGYAGLLVGLDDEEILPMALGYDADGITFSLGDAAHAYHVDSAMLDELFSDLEDELGISGTDMLNRYEKLFSALDQTRDIDMGPALGMGMLRDLLQNGTGTSSAVNVMVNGESVAGEHWDVRMDIPAVLATYDQWMADEENPVSDYLRALLDIYNGMMSADYAGFAEAFADLPDVDNSDFVFRYVGDLAQEDEVFYADFEMTLPEQSDYNFEPLHMYVCGDAAGMKGKYTFAMTDDDERMTMDMDFTADENGAVGNYLFSGTDDESSFDLSAVFTSDSFKTLPRNYTLDMNFNLHTDYSNADDVDESDMDPYRYASASDVAFNLSVDADSKNETRDGMPLKNLSVAMDLNVDSNSSYGYESVGLTEDKTNTSGKLRLDYNEQEAADGAGVSGRFDFAASMDDVGSVGLAFNTLTNKVPAGDIFAGAERYEVTAEEGTEAETQFYADVAKLREDARRLLDNESVAKLFTGLFGVSADELAQWYLPIDDTDAADTTDAADDGAFMRLVSDLSEAAQYYNGVIPDYMPPAGYVSSEVRVAKDGSYLTAAYANENGNEFSIALYAYDKRDIVISYYSLNESGKLEIQSSGLVTAYTDADGIFQASVSGADCDTVFNFTDAVSESELAEILAGLRMN